MILKLQREWTTDPSRSFVVGDRDTDVEAAIAAGVPGYKFEGGNLLEFLRAQNPPVKPVDKRTGAVPPHEWDGLPLPATGRGRSAAPNSRGCSTRCGHSA